MKPFNLAKVKVAKILQPLWWFIGLFMSGPSKSVFIKSILIFDFHLIGDMVLLMPLLEGIRAKYPEARLVLVAGPWAQDIVLPSGYIDELISFSAPWVRYGQGWRGWFSCFSLVRILRARTWDLGIEIRGDVRQIVLLAMAGAKERIGFNFTGGGPLLTKVVSADKEFTHIANFHRQIGVTIKIFSDSDLYQPKLILTGEEQDSAKKIPSYIGVHFGASVELRRVPLYKAQKLLVEIYTLYPDKNYVVFQLKEDPDFSRELFQFLYSKTKNIEYWAGNLRDFIVKASRCEHMYAMDSAAAHISCALGVKTSVIYGPSYYKFTSPIGVDGEIILKNPRPSCWPCNQKKCTSTVTQTCFPDDMSNSKPLIQI
jgi:heptosyltransferase-2